MHESFERQLLVIELGEEASWGVHRGSAIDSRAGSHGVRFRA